MSSDFKKINQISRKIKFLSLENQDSRERVCKRDLVPPERRQTGFSQASAIDLAPGMGC